MKKFDILEGERTPHIEYIPGENCLRIEGKSLHENETDPLYDKVENWLKAFLEERNKEEVFTIVVDLRFFSVQTSKRLLDIFRILDKEPNVNFKWVYEDEDMYEIGMDFDHMIKNELELIKSPNFVA